MKRIVFILTPLLTFTVFISLFIFADNKFVYSSDQQILEEVGYIAGLYNDFVIKEGRLYLTSYEKVLIYDVTDYQATNKVGEYYKTGCNFNAIDVVDNKAYVTQISNACEDDLIVLDVTDANNIYSVYNQPIEINYSGNGSEIAIKGNNAYIAYNQSGLVIVNFSNEPTVYSAYNPTPGLAYVDIDLVGENAYLSVSTGGFVVVNITNPEDPNLIKGIDLPQGPFATYWSNGIDVVDAKVYIAGGSVNKIFDISSLSNWQVLSSINANKYARDIKVSGEYFFVADDKSGIYAYDASNLSAPFLVSSFSVNEVFYKVEVYGNLIIANSKSGGMGLYILEFSGFPSNISPTPSPQPTPEPFLDLPWNYQSKGMSFSEAALSINSYFDHSYPLINYLDLNTGYCLPDSEENLPRELVNELKENPFKVNRFDGINSSTDNYNCHDGYDYGKSKANVVLGDPVLAAADGCAYYKYSKGEGNSIRIDHGNGYQTRYLHLLEEGLVTKETDPVTCIEVSQGQSIGKVGSTGRSTGPHIHFSVVEDKDKDGVFDDDYPWGSTDPFGWQAADVADPWSNFEYKKNLRNDEVKFTGNTSSYLWVHKLDEVESNIDLLGGSADLGYYKIDFPQDAYDSGFTVNLSSSPVAIISEAEESIGPSITITSNSGSQEIDVFDKVFTLYMDFSSFDLTRYNLDSLSIYSSTDGNTWTKENTTINHNTKVASITINHLSHFALVGERTDTVAPVTTIVLDGDEGQSGWFRSDVRILLEAEDNEGGLGVDYTMYKINEGEWLEYLEPIVFGDEGTYTISYYSGDNDENVEEIKEYKFNIDKTIPEVTINFDNSLYEIVVNPLYYEDTIALDINRNDVSYEIKDKSGNILVVKGKKTKVGQREVFVINSLQYNDESVLRYKASSFGTKYRLSDGEIRQLQQLWIKNGVQSLVNYDSKTNISVIFIHDDSGVQRIIQTGIVNLQLSTDYGEIKLSY